MGPFSAVHSLPDESGINSYSALTSCYHGKVPFSYHRKDFGAAEAVNGKLISAASSHVPQALPHSQESR